MEDVNTVFHNTSMSFDTTNTLIFEYAHKKGSLRVTHKVPLKNKHSRRKGMKIQKYFDTRN